MLFVKEAHLLHSWNMFTGTKAHFQSSTFKKMFCLCGLWHQIQGFTVLIHVHKQPHSTSVFVSFSYKSTSQIIFLKCRKLFYILKDGVRTVNGFYLLLHSMKIDKQPLETKLWNNNDHFKFLKEYSMVLKPRLLWYKNVQYNTQNLSFAEYILWCGIKLLCSSPCIQKYVLPAEKLTL